MNYIGSKHRLSNFIKQSVYEVVGTDLTNMVFCDLFAGTGIVGRNFKTEVKQVISNDMEYYSYVLNQNYIGNYKPFEYNNLIETLNNLKGIKGFLFEHYTENGKANRLYFSEENGKKIDAIRLQIEAWYTQKKITKNAYYFLLASLLESADKVANTASVYGAFLKQLKTSAQKPLLLQPAIFKATKNQHLVYNLDSNNLITQIQGNILYLDPPYNARQYGANYHLLNTIAKYERFTPKGKTGLPNYNKSAFCSKALVTQSFETLIQQANFNYIFLSYNNEGLMPASTIKTILSKYGNYSLFTTNYQRFKADKDQNRNHKAKATTEYLHVLEKQL